MLDIYHLVAITKTDPPLYLYWNQRRGEYVVSTQLGISTHVLTIEEARSFINADNVLEVAAAYRHNDPLMLDKQNEL